MPRTYPIKFVVENSFFAFDRSPSMRKKTKGRYMTLCFSICQRTIGWISLIIEALLVNFRRPILLKS